MSIATRPRWLCFCELAFSFNFIAFSFVMFSCWFPTGFSATFSTLAFVFALPLFFFRVNWVNLSLFERTGLVLFGWLLLSVLWSQSSVLNTLGYLSEYRLYFMVPVFATALLGSPDTQKLALYAAVVGAVIALITSYGLGLGWWMIEGAQYSLGNRIYHGFIMSLLLLASLISALNHPKFTYRLLAAAIATMVVYNVLNVETGRTGYLQVVAVFMIFIFLGFNRLEKALLATAFLLIAFVIAYFLLEQFNLRVTETLHDVMRMVSNNDYRSSPGYRLEFYRGALLISADHFLFGVGVGDVSNELRNRFIDGDIRVLTDNVHSEFMNMLLAGGLIAVVLFLGVILSMVYTGLKLKLENSIMSMALVGTGIIIFVSALFNSTIKDYGEKHALLIVLSLLAAALITNQANRRAVAIDMSS